MGTSCSRGLGLLLKRCLAKRRAFKKQDWNEARLDETRKKKKAQQQQQQQQKQLPEQKKSWKEDNLIGI